MCALLPQQVTAYALETAQERGQMFTRPGDSVYEGQVCPCEICRFFFTHSFSRPANRSPAIMHFLCMTRLLDLEHFLCCMKQQGQRVMDYVA